MWPSPDTHHRRPDPPDTQRGALHGRHHSARNAGVVRERSDGRARAARPAGALAALFTTVLLLERGLPHGPREPLPGAAHVRPDAIAARGGARLQLEPFRSAH